MLPKRHWAGLLSKPYNSVVQIDLWETNHVTVGELLVGSGALVASSLKGTDVRLFKYPYPVRYCLFINWWVNSTCYKKILCRIQSLRIRRSKGSSEGNLTS
jgi:hypothetical protein